MPDEPEKTIVENIPSIAGKISGVASANTPFVYFEDAVFYGFVNGVGKVALATNRLIAVGPDGSVLTDKVLVAHLVENIPAIRALRATLDGIILMAEPKPEGRSN